MAHSLRVLGTTLLAVLGLGAALAAQAQAVETNTKFTVPVGKYPAILHGEEAAGKTLVKIDGGIVSCANTLEGTLQEASKTLVAHQTTTLCTGWGLPATVTSTGCDYEYHLTTEVTVSGTEHPVVQAHVDIKCTGVNVIRITTATCEVQIKPQTGLTTVDFHNMTGVNPKDLTMNDTITGLAFSVTKDGIGCPLMGIGNRVNGEIVSNELMTIRGYKDNMGTKEELVNLDIG